MLIWHHMLITSFENILWSQIHRSLRIKIHIPQKRRQLDSLKRHSTNDPCSSSKTSRIDLETYEDPHDPLHKDSRQFFRDPF